MPDTAFEETERQFLGLLAVPTLGVVVRSTLYHLPGVPRGDEVRRRIATLYHELGELWDDPPDALVVTGAEPAARTLAAEPYWPALAHLLAWATTATVSAVLSCLSAHAALLLLDGVERVRLPAKCSGVFQHEVRTGHALTRGLTPTCPVPHSRLNDVPADALVAAGYTALMEAREVGWTLAAARRGSCELVLLQGHPEYEATTLLREYRRDVRRYLAGERERYPSLPVGYLGEGDQALLADFQRSVAGTRSASDLSRFPYEHVVQHLRNTWRPASEVLFANWIAETARRARGCRG